MATVVTGFLGLLQPALTGTSKIHGEILYYGLLGVRLVAIFIADGSWSTIRNDFTCSQNASDFCKATCFNQQFNFPFSALWSFLFIASLLPIVLLKTSIVWNSRSLKALHLDQHVKVTSTDNSSTAESTRKGQSNAARYLPFILCYLLLLVLEGVFLAVLVFMQLPRVHSGIFVCRTSQCPMKVECVIYSQMEKKMALVTLAITSVFILVGCLIYLISLLINCNGKV